MSGAVKDLNRRQLIQASFMSGLWIAIQPVFSFAQTSTSGALTPAQSGVDYSKQLAAADWKPTFLSEPQNETLISFGDLIIPATDTPGATAALCNRYIDTILGAEPAENQKKYLQDLAFLDDSSQKEYGKDFPALSADEQNELLRPLAYPARERSWGEDVPADPRRGSFQRLKSSIVFAYYSSEIGQRELGWDGAYTHGPYTGCQHSAGTHT
jgi:hypothetical protein